MKPSILYLIKFIICFLPESRCFKIKRILYRIAGVTIGKNVRICTSVSIYGNGKLIIGDNTWIGHQTCIICSSEVVLGCNVDIGPRVYIGTGSHQIDGIGEHSAGEGYNGNIYIDDGVWLGANVTILPNVVLGKKCIVAAGAVVTKCFVPFTLLGGIPAKEIKNIKIETE